MASLSTSSTQTRKALIIGNNYPNESGELSSCVNDMEIVHRILKEKCHFRSSEQKPNLNYMDMQETISDFSDTLNDGDVALFYFSGRGLVYDGVLFLCPCEMRKIKKESDIKRYCVSMHDVKDSLFEGAGENGIKIMIIDACRSRNLEHISTTSKYKGPTFSSIQKLPESANSIVIYATADATKAFEGVKLSQFTTEFVKVVATPGMEISLLVKAVQKQLVDKNTIPLDDNAMLDDFYFVPHSNGEIKMNETTKTSISRTTTTSTTSTSSSSCNSGGSNNPSAGETKATGDAATATAATATARVCFQQLPRHLRLGIFHCLTYRNYVLVSPTCRMFQTDLALSLENNLVLRCLHVPEDYRTLNEGYKRIEQSKGAVTTIVLGPGDHVVEEYTDEYGDTVNYLNIKCPVNIVGSRDVLDKSKIVVVGGFKITANGAHVEHLTIRHKKGYGVDGYSSCTLTDLMIDQCGGYGVFAYGSDAVLNCTNIMVSKSIYSGVLAYEGGTIILRGNRTLITDNCLDGNSYDYGLDVYGPSSKIKIVKPLTKEAISKGNKGGGDWGAWGGDIKQIETIEE